VARLVSQRESRTPIPLQRSLVDLGRDNELVAIDAPFSPRREFRHTEDHPKSFFETPIAEPEDVKWFAVRDGLGRILQKNCFGPPRNLDPREWRDKRNFGH
jgi:hypothetical protein